MRRGHVINFALGGFGVFASAALSAAIGVATDTTHRSFLGECFAGSAIIATVAGIVALVGALGDKDEAQRLERRRRMLPLVGMITWRLRIF